MRVIDFGLAQPGRASGEGAEIADTPASSARINFETTTSFGTPVYMAPEQHDRDKVDGRADQFAFCVALYEALFGRLPFAGATYGELVVNVTTGNLVVPGSSAVPPAVHAAIRRGLATDPDARFPSMDALLAAIQPRTQALAALAGPRRWRGGRRRDRGTLAVVKITAQPDVDPCAGGLERVAGAWDAAVQAKVKAAFTATARSHAGPTYDRVATGIDAYAADWVTRRRSVCEATTVRHDRSDAALDAGMRCLAERLDQLRALTSLFASADAQVVDHAVGAVEDLPPPATCTTITGPGRPLPASPEAQKEIAALRQQVPAIAELAALGKQARAIELLKPLLPRATAVNYPQLAAELYYLDGIALKESGQSAEAEAALHEVTRLAALAKDDVLAAKAWIALVSVVGFLEGRFDEGLELSKVAEVAIQRADADEAVAGELAYNVGGVYYQKGVFDKARAAFETALKLRVEALGEDNALVAKTINSIGGARLGQGDVAEARAAFERALALDDKVLGPTHPDTALPLENLGAVAKKQGDLAGATRYAERALKIFEEVNGPDNLNVGLTLNNLGTFALTRLDFAKANDYLTRAIAIFDKLDPDNPRVALPLIGRAQARDGLKDMAGAVADAERAVAVLDRKGTDPGQLADAKLNLADVLWDADGDHKRALALATAAQATYTQLGEPAKARLTVANFWLATHK